MLHFINGVDFHTLPIMKYWAPPASWSAEKEKTEIENRIFSGDWYGARKMDGAFYEFIKDEDGNMELIGRSVGVSGDYIDKLEWVPQCHDFFNDLPCGTCLLGELVFPNKEGSKNTTTIMGCLKDKAISRQAAGDKLHYYVFDCLAFGGDSYLDKPAETRFSVIDTLRGVDKIYEYIDFARYYKGEELWTKLQEYLAAGYEGIVITKADSRYEPGKRPSKTTAKVKKKLLQTIDCIVIGANEATKLYTGKSIETWTLWVNDVTDERLPQKSYFKEYQLGEPIVPVTKNYYHKWAGSLKIGLYKDGKMMHFGDLSGLSEDVLSNWRDYVGKVVTVGGMEIFKDGDSRAIRHPKCMGFRTDKTPTECTWDQVE